MNIIKNIILCTVLFFNVSIADTQESTGKNSPVISNTKGDIIINYKTSKSDIFNIEKYWRIVKKYKKNKLCSKVLNEVLIRLAKMNELHDVDLSNMCIAGINLTDKYLKGINFSNSDLSDSNFSLSNLSFSEFDGANLERSYFTNALLYKTSFKKSNLYKANFKSSNISSADMRESIFTSVGGIPSIFIDKKSIKNICFSHDFNFESVLDITLSNDEKENPCFWYDKAIPWHQFELWSESINSTAWRLYRDDKCPSEEKNAECNGREIH